MPKKGGKKKSGKKGKKKEKADEMTPTEALISYQLNLKQKELEELKFHLKSEQEKKERNIERNERLIEERRLYMEKMLEKAKLLDVRKGEKFTRAHVIFEMKENWRINKEEHAVLVDIHRKIKGVDKMIHRTNNDIIYWRSYRDNDLVKQSAQIKILEQQLLEMNESYESIANYLDRKFARDTEEIKTQTDEAINRQKDIAADKAVKILDSHSKQEVMDHEWLRNEDSVHSNELAKMMNEVQRLENENLEILSELFECTVEDLKVSRKIFLTQVNINDNLDTSNVVQYDLNQVFQDQLKQSSSAFHPSQRPKSAIQQAVENQYKQVMRKYTRFVDDDDEGDEEDNNEQQEQHENEDDVDVENGDDDGFGERDDMLSDLITKSDWNEYLDVGPLELKMLCVNGERVRLRTPYKKSAEEEMAEMWNPSEWPVTQEMLSSVIEDDDES